VHLSFHPLKIIERTAAAADAVSLTLAVPEELRDEYRFEPGQHVALRATLAGRELRRTYSMINGSAGSTLRLGIRVQPSGGLSHYLAYEARVGEPIDTLAPTGRFIYHPHPDGAGNCLAIASGSGITPILSIVTATLEREPASRVVLLYGNRSLGSTMFIEEIQALKNRFMGRFIAHFIMSREPQEMDVFNGRIDADSLREFAGRLFEPAAVDAAYLCGPGDMLASCREALVAAGVQAPVHFERFATAAAPGAAATAAPGAAATTAPGAAARGATTSITVVQDGRRRSFSMTPEDESVLAAAERAGLELPYSCRSGVCSTCRVKVVRGTVVMAHNVALEEWELAAGYTLACQARPTASELELSYDEK
jgi:ring-1,2-phenylacetyl-CoA epoxidase subunit PaaE